MPARLSPDERLARRRESARRYRADNPDKVRETSRRYRHANKAKLCAGKRAWLLAKPARTRGISYKKKYGLTIAEVDAQLVAQHGICPICSSDITGETTTIRKRPQPKACVDHCHETKGLRGLLCVSCNAGLGHFKDNADRLEAAAAYLRSGPVWKPGS